MQLVSPVTVFVANPGKADLKGKSNQFKMIFTWITQIKAHGTGAAIAAMRRCFISVTKFVLAPVATALDDAERLTVSGPQPL